MKKQRDNKGVIVLFVVIIVILSSLCVLFATGIISLKFNVVNNDNINNYTEQELINSVKITRFAFEKPRFGTIDGAVDTMLIDTDMNLDCRNSNIVGVRLSGYCVDTNDNKYVIDGPIQVGAFYCDNNISHSDSGQMMVGRILDSNGNEVDTTKIKWEKVNIKYCKIDNAKFVGIDGEVLSSLSKELNYEKNFN